MSMSNAYVVEKESLTDLDFEDLGVVTDLAMMNANLKNFVKKNYKAGVINLRKFFQTYKVSFLTLEANNVLVTNCFIVNGKGKIMSIGIATQSPTDKRDSRKGKLLSYQRAVSKR